MASAIAVDAADDTFADVEKLVYDTANKFIRHYRRRDREEVYSEALYLYQLAYLEYQQDRGMLFSTWVRYRVWKGLLETVRTEARRDRACGRVPMSDELARPPDPVFDVDGFLACLKQDAAVVVRLVIDSPADLTAAILDRGLPTPRNVRVSVREFLKDMGWAGSRIREAFTEIGRAL